MRKKLLWIMLLICMIAVLMAPAAFASPLQYGDLRYHVVDGGVCIESSEKTVSGELIIPEALPVYPSTQPVVEIGSQVFENRTGLTEVIIPDTVKKIGRKAFAGCTNLSSITMSANIESIGSEAFADTAIYQNPDNWQDGMLYLGNVLLYVEESVTDCNIKEGTTCVAHGAFDDIKYSFENGLESLSLPASLKYMDASEWQFFNLTSLTVAPGNSVFSAQEGVLFNKDQTELLKCAVRKTGDYTVPSTVKTICEHAFFDQNNLDNITLPSGLTTIGSDAFSYCSSLRSINIPAQVSSIGSHAFDGCNSLQSVEIASGNEHYYKQNGVVMDRDKTMILAITDEAFGTVQIPATVTDIGGCCGHNVTNYSVESGNSVYQSIDGLLYSNRYYFRLLRCPGEKSGSVTIAEGVSDIPWDAFEGCSGITSITLPSTLQNNGEWYPPFSTEGCTGLTAIHVAAGNTDYSEQDGVLFTKDLTTLILVPAGMSGSYTIPEGTTVISWNAFVYPMENLKTVTIPASVTTIRDYAFLCWSVKDIYYQGTRAQWDKISIGDDGGFFANVTLHCTDDAPAALSIASQPVDVTGAVGESAVFSVSATGADLTYQWQYNNPATGVWRNSSSATVGYNTDTLIVEATAARNGYQYRCIVTDAEGNSVTSDSATLTVFGIKTQPKNSTAVNANTASFKVVATGSGLTYQWQYKNPATGVWKNCSSATTGYNKATMTVAGVSGTTNRNGYQYRCVITDGAGNTVTSEAATLTVFAVKTQPKAATAVNTGTASFKVSATGSGLSYQWQYKNSSGVWKNCSSATKGYNTNTLTVQGVSGTTNRHGYQYRCIVTDANGNQLTSNAANLTVFAIKTQPKNVTAAKSSTATFKVAATGSGLTYQWQYKNPATGVWRNSSSATDGYNTATLNVVASAARNGYQYRCVITDGTQTITTKAVTLTVK